jgi:hypothetical protein
VTSFFVRVRDALGAPDVRLHDLRHFTATQLKVSDVAGDASFDMVCDRCLVRALGFWSLEVSG